MSDKLIRSASTVELSFRTLHSGLLHTLHTLHARPLRLSDTILIRLFTTFTTCLL